MDLVIGIRKPDDGIVVTGPEDAAKLLRELGEYSEEVFAVIYLSPDLEVTGYGPVAAGSLMSVSIEPKLIFRYAFLDKYTKYIIVAHNHPGQKKVKPSLEDRAQTLDIRLAGKYCGFPVMDCLIVGPETYYSFVQSGQLWKKDKTYLGRGEDGDGVIKNKGHTRAKREYEPFGITLQCGRKPEDDMQVH
jgi:DNA repair protein RadC